MSNTKNKWLCDKCGKWNWDDEISCSCEPDYMQEGGGLSGALFFLGIILLFFITLILSGGKK